MRRKPIVLLILTLLCTILSQIPLKADALEAESASFVNRNDGVWLWPLPASNYAINDWAGCNASPSVNSVCYFCGVQHGLCGANHLTTMGHNGVDLYATAGTNVYAAADGYLYCTATDWASRGITAVVEHPLGNSWSYYSIYQHLSWVNTNKSGQAVSAGEVIALSGATDGYGTGEAHLHFGIVMAPSGKGAAMASNPNSEISAVENGGWLLNEGYATGRILTNPALNSPAGNPAYYCGCETNVRLHAGSIMYTLNKSEVSIKEVPTVESCSITYYDASGNVWLRESAEPGSNYTLQENYPSVSGSYFSGWAYEQDAEIFSVRPSDAVAIKENICLYPLYVTHAQAISGNDAYIYNISDFTDDSYNITEVQRTIQTLIDTSYWSGWSDYSTNEIAATDTVEVKTATVYRYYYFLCPSCGAHEPFWGTCDCGTSLPVSSYRIKWSATPYNQSNYQAFSYTSAKYYTTSLDDGQLWIFSAGNLNHTAIGTIDSTSDSIVITTGYSSRSYIKQHQTIAKTITAYIITSENKDANNSAVRNSWVRDGDKWYYVDGEGNKVTNRWMCDSVGWVYLGSDGAMKTNAWVRDSVGWCYVGADGYVVTNCWKADSVGWCYLNTEGSMTKNAWVNNGGKWYWLDGDGYMVSNRWMRDSVGWVYLGSDGAMKTNAWVRDSVGWCYVGSDGYTVANCWKADSAGVCYLNSSGYITKNEWVWYRGAWYYCDAKGYGVTGRWKWIGGYEYYFYSNGIMAADAWIDGYYVNSTGRYVPGR